MLPRICLGLAFLSGVLTSFDSTAAQFGRTAGNFAVPADGSANYSIPIWTPPGVRGLQPSLALSYNSNAPDGLLGIGWSLSGLSAISRCNLTYAQDGVAGSPQLTSSDRFCMNGNRLRTTNGSTYGAAGSTYQTEIANFSNITANGTAGSGPAWFKVQAKSGLTYEYGNTADSAILAQGSTSVRVWALNAVRDRNGNAMTFTYTNDTTNGSYRPASIQYTYTGSSTSNNGYSVTFTYQSRPSTDVDWAYTIGGVNNQLNYLTAITVNTISGSTATMVHGYELTYANAPVTGRLRISTIQECASSTTDCFSTQSSVGYQNGTAGWGAEIADSGNSTNLAFALPVDVNGDGIDDLVYPDPTSGHWFYELGTTSGTFLGPYDTGIASTNYQSALAIDFYVNGRKDIIFPNSSGNWRVMQFVSSGAAFSFVDTTTSAAGVVPGSATVGDVDGDGREDLIYAVSGGTGYAQPDNIYYRLNTGGAFSTTQGTLASFPNGATCFPCVKFGNSQPFGNPAFRYNSQIRKLDFNGDGRTDFLVYLGTCSPDRPAQCGTTSPISYTWSIFLSQPNGTYAGQAAVTYTSGTTPNQPPLVGDFNGDGCSDIAFVDGGSWRLQYGTCGRSGAGTVLSAPVSTGLGATSTLALAIDWDGDGRTDLLQPTTGATPDWAVSHSLGNSMSTFTDTSIPIGGATTALVGDFSGDGIGDLTYNVSTALKSRIHSGVAADLATSFADAYGVTYSPSYIALAHAASSVYAKGSSQVYPQQDYDGPFNVVPSYTASDGIGGTYTMTSFYSAAIIDLKGRGFEGFQGIRVKDSRTGIYDFKHYSNTFPTTGLVSEDDTLQPNDTTDIRTVTNVVTSLTLDSTTNNQRSFPYVSTSTVKAYELGGAEDGSLIATSLTNYGTPDIYGNFTSVETTLTDNDTGSPYLNQQWTSTTATSYTEDHSANWCLKLPTEADVTNTAPGVPAITRHTSYVSPDYVNCRQTQQVVEPSSPTYKVTTVFGYDSFGNPNSQTVTGVGMAARTAGINWGVSGQFPTIVTNALTQQTLVSFDPSTGKQLSQTDPNGVITSWHYDTFARKIKEIRPDSTSTTWAYNNCSTAGCVNTNNHMTVVATIINTDSTTFSTSNTYLDGFDRTLVTSKLMLNGAYDRNEVQYDNMGRVHLQGFPCTFVSCVQYWTTNTYDILNRLTQSQRPISASNSTLQTTLYGHQGRTTTVTDAQSKVTTTITKVTGSLGRAKDQNGYYVSFNHDAFGSVLSVTDSLSNTLKSTIYSYGLSAFPQSSTDMDLGARSYTIDALGELTAYSDAKSQNFSTSYDALSRSITRTEPDLTTTWTWGVTAASHNIGKLASVSAVSSTGTHSDSYIYDAFGRLTDHTIVNPADGSHSFDYVYSTTNGLVQFIDYPVSYPSTYRLQVGYFYSNGVLKELYDKQLTSTIWWVANATNPRGQVTVETTEDLSGDPQVTTHRTYDAVTGWVGSIQTGVGGGSALQNESYLFDLVGNVTQRQNNNAGLTENFYYDNLYRLDHSVLGTTTNLQMCYDNTGGSCTANVAGMGNITSRSDIAGGAAWTYDPVRKHAVTQAGSSSFTYSYDGNGNVSARNGSTIGWTSYNYPSSVATSTESASFDYGPDRQRWRMIYSGPSGPETTYYSTPQFERVDSSSGTDYRHYLYAGARPVVVISRTTAGAVNVRSLLADHQGSISSIVTNSSGTSLVSESFTAFGNRREASTWSGTPTSTERTTMDGVTREGYTFQTVLGSMGLNHMNGRVQDAVTGRFLSPDPQVSNPTSTQAYNLYGYVMNNPLSSTDPSGFHRCKTCIEGQAYGDTAHSYVTAPYGEATISDGMLAIDVNDPLDLGGYVGNVYYMGDAFSSDGAGPSGGTSSGGGSNTGTSGSSTAQSGSLDPYPALTDPNYFSVQPDTTSAQSGSSSGSSESGPSVEGFSAGLGYLGAAGDGLKTSYFSRAAGGTSALAAEFWTSVGEGISRWTMYASVAVDGIQAVSNFGTQQGLYNAVDTFVDVGVSRLGLVGTGVGLLWTATGGMKGAVANPALQPLPPPF